MTQSHIGKRVWFSPALPATNDKAGFEALTWTEIGIYQGGARFGFDQADIDVGNLTSGVITKVKGMGTGQASTLSFANATAFNTERGTLKTLADGINTVGSIRITRAITAGTPVAYAAGFYKSFLEMEESGTSHEGFTVVFQQNAQHVVDVMPTPP